MFQKEALSTLLSKIREAGAVGETDMRVLRETCMNAAACADLNGRIKLIACFEGAASQESAALKAERAELIRRLEYNLVSVNAMAAYYGVDSIFTGDPHSSDISVFCGEFTANLQSRTKSEKE